MLSIFKELKESTLTLALEGRLDTGSPPSWRLS